MFSWEKRGRIFNPLDHKNDLWLNEFAQAPSTIIFDDFVRVYFSCRPPADSNGKYVSYSAFVDLDRRDLSNIVNVAKTPVLPLGPRGSFDEFGIYPVSVIKNGDEYWMYYTGHTRCESVPFNTAIGLATSKDGETFHRLGPGPVIGASPHEPFVLSGPKIRKFNGKFYLHYITGKKWIKDGARVEVVYKIRMAVSDDGINWQKQNRDIIVDKIDENETQASPDVFFADGKYHMFFCYKHATGFREDTSRAYRIGYASSEDLLEWKRDDDVAGITVSPGDDWDSQTVAYPHVFTLDGQTHMLYLGNEVGRYGFGLATMKSNA